MNPKFSIIVGMYNQLATLPMLVEALQKQTLPDFEVHFCDDGSNDGTEEYIKKLETMDPEDLGFSFEYHRQEHKGMRLAKNINQGIKAAKGEYCVFIMGDSFPEQDYLELLYQWVQPYRMICGIRIQLDFTGKQLEGVDLDWRLKRKRIPDGPAVILSMPWSAFTGNGLTIPTSAFREYGPWWEAVEGYGGEDNEIVARLFYKAYIPWSVPALRVYHRWHKGQETASGNGAQVVKKIQDYYIKSK